MKHYTLIHSLIPTITENEFKKYPRNKIIYYRNSIYRINFITASKNGPSNTFVISRKYELVNREIFHHAIDHFHALSHKTFIT